MRDIFIAGCKVLGIYFLFSILLQLVSLFAIILATPDYFKNFDFSNFMLLSSDLILSLFFMILLLFGSNFLANTFKMKNSVDFKINISGRQLFKIGILIIGILLIYSSLYRIFDLLVGSPEYLKYGYTYNVMTFIIKFWIALVPFYFIFQVDRVVDFLYKEDEKEAEKVE